MKGADVNWMWTEYWYSKLFRLLNKFLNITDYLIQFQSTRLSHEIIEIAKSSKLELRNAMQFIVDMKAK